MVFNSLTFVVFFASVLGLHSLPLPWTIKKINAEAERFTAALHRVVMRDFWGPGAN
jgi:hypothetical protein